MTQYKNVEVEGPVTQRVKDVIDLLVKGPLYPTLVRVPDHDAPLARFYDFFFYDNKTGEDMATAMIAFKLEQGRVDYVADIIEDAVIRELRRRRRG